jgi:hypothetical protein
MLGHSLTVKIVPKNGFKSVFRQVSQPDKGLVTIYCADIWKSVTHVNNLLYLISLPWKCDVRLVLMATASIMILLPVRFRSLYLSASIISLSDDIVWS